MCLKIENFNVVSEIESDIKIRLSWKWLIDGGPVVELPSCKVFLCMIPEKRIFDRPIFKKSEIMDKIENILGIKVNSGTPAEQIASIERFAVENPQDCVCHEFSLMNLGNVNHTYSRSYSTEKYIDHLLLVCVFSDGVIDKRLVPIVPASEPEYSTGGTLGERITEMMRGYKCLTFTNKLNKPLVMIDSKHGSSRYMLLPASDKFYINRGFDLSTIKLRYLSSLIND